MRFPLSWLKTFVDLPPDLPTLSQVLMRSGIGLEAVEDPGAALQNVVVAEVTARSRHPNADKLSLCTVSDGQRDYQIVCGAPNVAQGLKVPLAKEGAELPGDFKIKRSKIRGVESEGMLCSAEELGLPKGVDGLLVLDPGLALGQPLAQALGLDDPVLTLETTANRPDHLSLRGLAREISALGALPLKDRKSPAQAAGSPDAGFSVATDAAACSYYSARRIQGVRVGPSPDWLRNYLEKSGIRSISTVVDATNCVLLEYGQPMHAFDAARLSGGRLEARLAGADERIRTLDGQDRVLEAGDIVIADASGPQALGGIMGGAHSEVGPATTDLLLEAAVFPAVRIRRTARRLGLASESSHRFERGVDALAVDEAMDRCVALILELAGGSLQGPRLSAGNKGEAPAALTLEPERVNALLGTGISGADMAALLRRRFFTVEAQAPSPKGLERYQVLPPTWRRDVREGVDLAEEILQMSGVDGVKGTDLDAVRAPDPDDVGWNNAWLLRGRLAAMGLSEASSLSYLEPGRAEAWAMGPLSLRMDNPLSAELSLLRPSLLPGLVACALVALKRRKDGVAFFELGRVFRPAKDGIKESERVAVVLAGPGLAGQWNASGRDWDFYDLKGMAEALGRNLDLTFRATAATAADTPDWAHPGRCASISIGGLGGLLAALHPALLETLEAPKGLGAVLVMELEPQSQVKAVAKEPRYAAFSRVPSVERDLSCLMDADVEAGRILDFIKNEGGLGAARVLDRFEGAPLPPGRKSLTFRLTYAAEERSLTDAEVNRSHDELVQRLETALPVEVRR
jgi:phenylalanyl-tRNA synthetase beta chain